MGVVENAPKPGSHSAFALLPDLAGLTHSPPSKARVAAWRCAEAEPPMIKVALIEDDEKTRDAWAIIMDGTPGFRCVSTHGTAEEALQGLSLEKTDLVVVDLGLPGLSGVELIRR